MKYYYTLLTCCVCALLTAQDLEIVKGIEHQIRNVDALGLSSEIPENYIDYFFAWNDSIGEWDSTQIIGVEFDGDPESINAYSQEWIMDEGEFIPATWIHAYGLNLAESDPLDPVSDYTYFPADSIHAVYYAPFVGEFPVSTYYTSTPDGSLSTEMSYYNTGLLGDPIPFLYSLGGTRNHYDVDGKLTSYVVDWEGLDSTSFSYDAAGLLKQSVEMLGEFGNVADEYVITDYTWDEQERVSEVITKYYFESLQVLDLKDSTVYKYSDDGYRRESFTYDVDEGIYYTGSAVQYQYPSDTIEIEEIFNTSTQGEFVTQRARTRFDDQGRFVRRLTQNTFLPQLPMHNTSLIVRQYEQSTTAVHEADAVAMPLHWYQSGLTLEVKWEESHAGNMRLYASDGRQCASVDVHGNACSIDLGSTPSGIYFLALSDASRHVLGSAPVRIIR